MVKKIIRFLLLADFIWSVPLAIIGFVGFGIFGEWFFGEGFGFYDPSFLHAMFYAAVVSIFGNGIALGAMWFNWRLIYRHYKDGAKLSFNELSPRFKAFLVLFIYFSYFFTFLFVWSRLV